MTTTFLAFSSNYVEIEVALFNNSSLLDKVRIDKSVASQKIVQATADLLTLHCLTLNDLSFIAANQGPGPFTTLRVVIASVNGFSFATKIPLIGVDGLHALLNQYLSEKYPLTIALLNAFNDDLYFAIAKDDVKTIETGCKKSGILLEELKIRFTNQPIQFLGNGVELHRQMIEKIFGASALIPNPLPQATTVEQIGRLGLEIFKKQSVGCQQLFPLYLKQIVV